MVIRLSALIASLSAVMTLTAAGTHYVDCNNLHPSAPYFTWATAATNIQDAVNYANGDTILVTNGVYQYGAAQDSNLGTNRVHLSNAMKLQSVNGPEVTIIKGYQVPGTTNGSSAVRCVYMEGSSVLSGFTLINGATMMSGLSQGGGVYCVDSNCLVTNCIITKNSANFEGGGTYGGKLVNCKLISNSVGVLQSVGDGGGVYGNNGVLINCLITGNFSANTGGAAASANLINCTVVSNVTATSFAGSIHQCKLNNCVVYYNLSSYTNSDATNGAVNYFTNCCLSPALFVSNANNFTNAPAFLNPAAGDFHLQIGSPCINAGDNSFVTNTIDLDGNPRIQGGTVDVGAYESGYTNTVHYVSLTSTSALSPYSSWATAATNLQDAISAAQNSDFIIAAGGIYKTGSTVIFGQESNRVSLTNPVTLLALYGPHATVIVGNNQMRCVYVGSNAVLSGFSLADGRTQSTGDLIKEQSGGGAWCETSGIISNCIIGGLEFPYADGGHPDDSCTSAREGGGVYGGTVYDSIITGNTSALGGGAAATILYNCLISSNRAGNGGVYLSTLYNCKVMGNQSQGSGGGTTSCTNYNCTLANNYAGTGGGVAEGAAFNCTIASNTAFGSGGGISQCTALNSIIYFNSAPSGSNFSGGALVNCDTLPLPSGLGNITNDPRFISLTNADFHLQSNSPCINAGQNIYATASSDLDGNARVVGGTVDLGAFEFQTPTSVLSYAWAQQYGLPVDGSADYADADSDGMNNWQEWKSGTNPTNAISFLQMLVPSNTNVTSNFTVNWSSVAGVNYFIQRASGLTSPLSFSVVQSNIIGQAGTTSYTDINAATNGLNFYRVGVQ